MLHQAGEALIAFISAGADYPVFNRLGDATMWFVQVTAVGELAAACRLREFDKTVG